MTPKQYLSQIGQAKARITQREYELYILRGLAEKITPSNGGGGSTGGSDKVGNAVARLVDLEAELAVQIQELAELQHRIIGEIHQMDDERYESLLYARYVQQKTLEKIADDMGYSYDHIRRLHGYALMEFGRKVDTSCHTMPHSDVL